MVSQKYVHIFQDLLKLSIFDQTRTEGSVIIVLKTFRKAKKIEQDVENYFAIFFLFGKLFRHLKNKIKKSHFFIFLLLKLPNYI